MSVIDGQRANQKTFNDAFISRAQNSDTTAVVGLNNNASGALIPNAQQKINDNESDIQQNQADINTLNSTKQNLSEKAQPDGYAPLDSLAKLPVEFLPTEVVTAEGNWDADTNTPELVDGTGDLGQFYVVFVAGTQDFGNGPQTFALGDWVLYDSHERWVKSINSNMVTSVNGQVADVSLGLNELTDVDLTTPPNDGESLVYDSTSETWVSQLIDPAVSLGGLTDVDLSTPPDDGDFLSYDAVSQTWLPVPEPVSGGSGDGSKNYFDSESSRFEGGTIGNWETDDGSGLESAGLTLSVTNVSGELIGKGFSLKLVKAAANHEGEFAKLASQTIDPIDRGKQLFGSFAFKPISGYVSGDLILEVYDVTNSAVLYSGASEDLELLNVTDPITFNYNAYLESTTAQVEFRLKVNNTNTNGFTMTFDEFGIGPASVLPATFERYEEITLVNSGANNMSGTFAVGRTGNQVSIIGRENITFTSSTAPASAIEELPSWGRPLNTITNVFATQTNVSRGVNILTDGSISFDFRNGALDPLTRTSTGPFTITYTVPSTPYTMTTNELGLQRVRVRARQFTQTVNTTSDIIIPSIKDYDNTNSFNLSTGVFTAPRSGKLKANVAFRGNVASASTTNTSVSVFVFRNGTNVTRFLANRYVVTGVNLNPSDRGTIELEVNKGDTIDFRITRASQITSFTLDGTDECYIELEMSEDLTLIGAVKDNKSLTMPEVSRTFIQRDPNYSTDDFVPIVASGSNSDGNWVRYADGSQIVTRSCNVVVTASTVVNTSSFTFPISFLDNSYRVTPQPVDWTTGGTQDGGTGRTQNRTASGFELQARFGVSPPSSSGTVSFHVIVIGKWK